MVVALAPLGAVLLLAALWIGWAEQSRQCLLWARVLFLVALLLTVADCTALTITTQTNTTER